MKRRSLPTPRVLVIHTIVSPRDDAADTIAALKCDLRGDPGVLEKLDLYGLSPVSYAEGLAVAERIDATRYVGEWEARSRAVARVLLLRTC
jgi:hypothetical protein